VPLPDDVSRLTVDAATRAARRTGVFGARFVSGWRNRRRVRAGGPLHHQQLEKLPDGSRHTALIPEVNAEHLALLDVQAASRGWKGRIVTNPNCSTIVLSMALAPLRAFGLKTS
jgi:hypothetical protein